jgi:hypothetical protein
MADTPAIQTLTAQYLNSPRGHLMMGPQVSGKMSSPVSNQDEQNLSRDGLLLASDLPQCSGRVTWPKKKLHSAFRCLALIDRTTGQTGSPSQSSCPIITTTQDLSAPHCHLPDSQDDPEKSRSQVCCGAENTISFKGL